MVRLRLAADRVPVDPITPSKLSNANEQKKPPAKDLPLSFEPVSASIFTRALTICRPLGERTNSLRFNE